MGCWGDGEMKLRIAVLGPNKCSKSEYELGLAVGKELARKDCVLICGGLGGMMEAAAKGAKSEGGMTVGILPNASADDANAYIDVPIPTGLGAFRNMLVVRSADAVIAIEGKYGTLSEIAFALRLGVPVIGLNTWTISKDGKTDPGIHVAKTPREAAEMAVQKARAAS